MIEYLNMKLGLYFFTNKNYQKVQTYSINIVFWFVEASKS